MVRRALVVDWNGQDLRCTAEEVKVAYTQEAVRTRRAVILELRFIALVIAAAFVA